jgi:hypothetical protein
MPIWVAQPWLVGGALGQMVRMLRQCGALKGQGYEWLEKYVGFHVHHGTLTWLSVPEPEYTKPDLVTGCMVIWPVAEEWARFSNEPIVGGHPDWSADSVYVAQAAAVRGTGRNVLRSCVKEFVRRFPQVEGKKWIAHRDGRLVRLDDGGYRRWLRV